MPRAYVRAVNHTFATGRTQLLRKLAAATRLPQKRIRPSVILRRATLRQTEAKLVIAGRPIPAIAFVASARAGRPVRLPTGLAITPALPTPAFVQTMPRSGHTGIFKRGGRPRLPIAQLFGPSIPALVDPQVPVLKSELEQKLRARFEHELAFLTRGRGEAPE
jgi:hypothetical protein